MPDLQAQLAHIRSGQMYNDLTPELVAARQRAVLLSNQYNASFGQSQEQRLAILRKLLGKVGVDAHFEPHFRCEFGSHIEIGEHFYANYDCVMLDGGGIHIGNHVLLAPPFIVSESDIDQIVDRLALSIDAALRTTA